MKEVQQIPNKKLKLSALLCDHSYHADKSDEDIINVSIEENFNDTVENNDVMLLNQISEQESEGEILINGFQLWNYRTQCSKVRSNDLSHSKN